MKSIKTSFNNMVADTSPEIQGEVAMEFTLSNRINELMVEKGLSKVEFARAIGKRPSEVTKWLSGQHNFTVRTLALLSAFFGESLVSIETSEHSLTPLNA